MSQKYKIGKNTYELKTDYLGYLPEGKKDWYKTVIAPFAKYRGRELKLVSPKGKEVTLTFHQVIVKDAFPRSFFSEERANDWHRFCKVSFIDSPKEIFLIPLH